MKTGATILTIAAFAGLGYYIGKKIIENKEKQEQPKAFAEVKQETCGDKVRKASMFAVGTLRTTADKIAEGINQVATGDMVKKGEETVEQVKETKDEIKKEIADLKNLVTSINTTPAEVEEKDAFSVFDDHADLFSSSESTESDDDMQEAGENL